MQRLCRNHLKVRWRSSRIAFNFGMRLERVFVHSFNSVITRNQLLCGGTRHISVGGLAMIIAAQHFYPVLKTRRTINLESSKMLIPGNHSRRPQSYTAHTMQQRSTEPATLNTSKPGILKAVVFYFSCGLRAIQLALYFLPIILVSPVYLLGGTSASTFNRLLRRTLELAGPAFIKLGQWASTRPDIFSRQLSDELSVLHDQVSITYSVDATKKILEKNFGPEFLDRVVDADTISSEVIGSGCIAQVHKARLSGTDRWVAIKVRHAGVIPLIEKDLQIMHGVAWLIDLIPTMEWISLPEEVEQFAKSMMRQLNFEDEANNLVRFRENFRDHNQIITFPKPLYPFVSEEVLVEDFESGLPVRYIIGAKDQPELKSSVADMGLSAFLKMMINDNFIHADLHPGNILVQLRNHSTGEIYPKERLVASENRSTGIIDPTALQQALDSGFAPRLIFLDAGLVTELSDGDRVNFLDLFSAIVDGDGARVAQLMVDRSRVPTKKWLMFRNQLSDNPRERCYDYFGFESKMAVIIRRVQKNTFSLSNVRIGDILTEVFTMVRKHHVKIESEFTNLVVSMMVLEGLGRQLDDDVDLLKAARPFLRFKHHEFYTSHHALGLRLSAFLEARYWLTLCHDPHVYEVIDTLIFNNF